VPLLYLGYSRHRWEILITRIYKNNFVKVFRQSLCLKDILKVNAKCRFWLIVNRINTIKLKKI
jgi:hypothetical protein